MRKVIEEVVRPAPTGRMPDDSGLDPLDEEAVTPEEQGFYDTFVRKAFEFIHGPKSSRQVLKHMNQPDLSVEEAVGRTTAMIARNILSSARGAGAKISPEAVLNAGQEIVEELLEVGAAAKIFPIEWPENDSEEEDALTPEQQALAQDSYAMAAKYFGDDYLQSDEGKALQGEAQAEVLRNIQNEAKTGTLSPDFMVTDQNTVEGGVKRALFRQAG